MAWATIFIAASAVARHDLPDRSVVGVGGGKNCTARVYLNTICPDRAFAQAGPVPSVEACSAACCSTKGCEAFAWKVSTSPNAHECHLKNQATPGRMTHDKNTICGILPGNPGGQPPVPGPMPGPPPGPTPPPVPAPTPGPPDPTAPRPHFVFILQDDLGFDDVGWNNPESAPYSKAITGLAHDGIILTNHYVHWHCSPTRRSFLTGRLPIHHGEMLSGDTSDDMDLRWNLISQKLKLANYTSYWFGKGHTGFMSMAHLPTHRDFAHWTGFMGGAQSYTADSRWQDEGPFNETTYSSDLFGTLTLDAVQRHDPRIPMMVYLPWQAVHAPYDIPPPQDNPPNGTDVQLMLNSADQYVQQLVDLLKNKGMWDNTLVVYTADNGGTADGGTYPGPGPTAYGGTNFPKRGNKHTNWQGGMNGAAFVSGGFLPDNLRGTTSDVAMHIVDWYATFCALAGVDSADNSGVKPLPVDPSLPPVNPPPKDIYGANAWPGIDGVNVWPILTDPDSKSDRGAAHRSITLSREVILINGTWKLVVAQPDPSVLAHKESMPPTLWYMMGWRLRNQTWLLPSKRDESGCGMVFIRNESFKPCLFNIAEDDEETTDLSQSKPDLVQSMWQELNVSYLSWYHSRSPSSLIGPCNATCAAAHWRAISPASRGGGPICSVPGCTGDNNN